jgi:hypothetical protein
MRLLIGIALKCYPIFEKTRGVLSVTRLEMMHLRLIVPEEFLLGRER